jgi:hypothetical protein
MLNPQHNSARHHERRPAWLVFAMVALQVACASTDARHAAPPDNVARLRLGPRQFDTLACESGRCSVWYRVAVHRAQRISVEANEVDGRNFELAMYNGALEVLDQDTTAWKHPRRLSAVLESGLYYVRVLSEGPHSHPLQLEIRAIAGAVTSFDAPTVPPHSAPEIKAPPTQAAEPPKERVAPTPLQPTRPPRQARPAPQPTRRPSPATPELLPAKTWIRSEVIEVERANGTPIAVLIDAGTATGLVEGQAGRLVRRGRVIGNVLVIDVYPTGSRAMIVSEIAGDITADTVVEVLDPPNR